MQSFPNNYNLSYIISLFLMKVEPYITTVALYDARKGVKVSEDFSFDINDMSCQKTLDQSDEALSSKKQDTETRRRTSSSSSNNSLQTPPSTPTTRSDYFEPSWLTYPKQVKYNIQYIYYR